jgi:hypothetical protein
MRSSSALLRPLLGGSLLALLLAATVSGYAGQVAATISVSATGDAQACGTPLAISALIEDAQDSPIAEQPVEWSLGNGAITGDAIADTTTTTDANGIATAQVTLSCSEPHVVTLLVTADAIQGSVVLSASGDSLPRTDTATLAPETSLPGVLLAALAVVVGFGAILHRLATERR